MFLLSMDGKSGKRECGNAGNNSYDGEHPAIKRRDESDDTEYEGTGSENACADFLDGRGPYRMWSRIERRVICVRRIRWLRWLL